MEKIISQDFEAIAQRWYHAMVEEWEKKKKKTKRPPAKPQMPRSAEQLAKQCFEWMDERLRLMDHDGDPKVKGLALLITTNNQGN